MSTNDVNVTAEELAEALAEALPERERREHERVARIMAAEALQRADDAQQAGNT